MSTIAALEHEACTGCGACANVCPNNSIEMLPDKKGFLYPHIIKRACLMCGKCVQSCPVLLKEDNIGTEKIPYLYAAWSLDTIVRYHSTSGGVFTELARYILKEHGYVAGAGYTDDHMVEHCLINTETEISQLRQSKYVQSNTGNIYQKVVDALRTKKPVLFTGTPCQCAALATIVGQEYDNLYLCDFICRGVNAPLVYQKYLEELEQQYNSKVKTVRFKDKTYGWNHFGTKVIFENGQEYFKDRDTDPFMYGYIKKDLNLYIRGSCSQCKFKGISRSVDLTLGDFWGVKLGNSSDDMKQGVSAVLIHSEKGRRLFEAIGKNLYWEEKQLVELLPGNSCLVESVIQNKEFTSFFETLLREKRTFSQAISYFRKIKE